MFQRRILKAIEDPGREREVVKCAVCSARGPRHSRD